MLCIVLQRETGSALVYLAFFLMLYREGMTGSVLFSGAALVLFFVVGIRYAEPTLLDTTTSVGPFVVMLLIQVFTSVMIGLYCRRWLEANHWLAISLTVTLICLLFAVFVIPFDLFWVQLALCVLMVVYLLWRFMITRYRGYLWVAAFAAGSVVFFNSADYALNHVLEKHQRTRINVLLGLEEDLKGAGYNVHQSEIAIGSGGLAGKGFLNGTQTKLKYVPEQDTDFIFCTVGEEEGFLGAAGVLVLFLALILRLIHLSERQPTAFGRIYGYCVLSVFLFHVFINVGMVLGLAPVIGIPLPFFSYGGSSLWGFTLLLFIFLRIDAGRYKVHN
jgi:rod shape determining protein RodA